MIIIVEIKAKRAPIMDHPVFFPAESVVGSTVVTVVLIVVRLVVVEGVVEVLVEVLSVMVELTVVVVDSVEVGMLVDGSVVVISGSVVLKHKKSSVFSIINFN